MEGAPGHPPSVAGLAVRGCGVRPALQVAWPQAAPLSLLTVNRGVSSHQAPEPVPAPGALRPRPSEVLGGLYVQRALLRQL